MQTILVPTDFSFCAQKAVDYAIMLAKKSNAALMLLHVYDSLEYGFINQEVLISQYKEAKMREAFDKLHQLQQVISETESIQSEVRLYEGSLVNCINKIGKEIEVSLVVMGTMGASGLKGKLIGSQTAAVIRHCTLPVLAVPATYEGAEIHNVVLALKENEQNSDLKRVFDLVALLGAQLKVLICSPEGDEAFEVMEDSRNLQHFMQGVQHAHPMMRKGFFQSCQSIYRRPGD
jgi:nucleotide-binding universal stress UspA family protein